MWTWAICWGRLQIHEKLVNGPVSSDCHTLPWNNRSCTTRVVLNFLLILIKHGLLRCSMYCSTHRPQPVGSQPPTRSCSAIHSGLDSYTAFPASMVAASLEEPPVLWASMTHREPPPPLPPPQLEGWQIIHNAHTDTFMHLQFSIQVHTHSSITYAHMII